jgi:WD40 repeat protein
MLAPWNNKRLQGNSADIFSQLPEKIAADVLQFVNDPATLATNDPTSAQKVTADFAADAVNNSPEVDAPSMNAGVVPLPPPLPLAQPMQPGLTEAKGKLSRRQLLIGGAATVGVAAVAVTGVTLLPGFISELTKKAPGPQKLIAGVPLMTLTGHSNTVNSVLWDPSGRYVATGGDDTRVMLWDVAKYIQQKPNGYQTISTPDKEWKFAYGILTDCMSWSYDGSTLGVAGAADSKVYLLDALGKSVTPQVYTNTENPSMVNDYIYLAWSPINNSFITGINFENHIVLWQKAKATGPVQTFEYTPVNNKAPGGLNNITWSIDERYITAITSDFKVPVWDVKTRKMIQNIYLPSRTAQHYINLERSALKCSPVDKTMFAVSDLDAVLLYDFVHNKLMHSLGTNDPEALTLPNPNPNDWSPQVGGITWSPNGRYVAASYGRSNQVYIWDLKNLSTEKKNGLVVQSLLFGLHNGHSETITDLAWSPDGRYIATASFDKTVIIWRVDGA